MFPSVHDLSVATSRAPNDRVQPSTFAPNRQSVLDPTFAKKSSVTALMRLSERGNTAHLSVVQRKYNVSQILFCFWLDQIWQRGSTFQRISNIPNSCFFLSFFLFNPKADLVLNFALFVLFFFMMFFSPGKMHQFFCFPCSINHSYSSLVPLLMCRGL